MGCVHEKRKSGFPGSCMPVLQHVVTVALPVMTLKELIGKVLKLKRILNYI